MLSRRELLALTAAAGFIHCASPRAESDPDSPAAQGRLDARPGVVATAGAKGHQTIDRSLLYVPESLDPSRPAPLIVTLHGAGGGPRSMIQMMTSYADRIGAIVLAPQSRAASWDIIGATLGPDVAHIDDLLANVFSRYTIDAKRLAVSGFSDGASYALTLGLGNGDLFTHVMAFSPGFMAGKRQVGAPRFFISHGTNDKVLPIDPCSRRIVRELKSARHDVTYREFTGGHAVPEPVAIEAIDWFMA
jgi:phospholipase/carboxylesterase